MSGVSDLEAKTFRQEIELLKRLQGNQRIVKLIDYEERMKSDGTGQELLVVMEKGSRDLGNLIKELSGNYYLQKTCLFLAAGRVRRRSPKRQYYCCCCSYVFCPKPAILSDYSKTPQLWTALATGFFRNYGVFRYFKGSVLQTNMIY